MFLVDKIEGIMEVVEGLLIAVSWVQFSHDTDLVQLLEAGQVVDPKISRRTKKSAELLQATRLHDRPQNLSGKRIARCVAFPVVLEGIKKPHLHWKFLLHSSQSIIACPWKKNLVSKIESK